MSFTIGNVNFQNAFFMAPMEGITDVPFRKQVQKHGCGVTCTQMVHARGLVEGTQSRLKEVVAIDETEKPVGFQLCGHEPVFLAEASQMIEQMGFSFIDLNMGCPAKNVVKRGSGSALLKTPEKARLAIRAIVQNTKLPVTVKIRAGWDDTYKNGGDIAEIAQEEGVKLISVHARTRAQKFKGKADWKLISDIKKKVSIPVIGNGDIFKPGDINTMLAESEADGVMIARGALGNPWLFSRKIPSVSEVKTTLFEHMEDHLTFYPRVEAAVVTFRKHIVWYTKGLKGASEFRVSVFKEKDLNIVKQMLHTFFDHTERVGHG